MKAFPRFLSYSLAAAALTLSLGACSSSDDTDSPAPATDSPSVTTDAAPTDDSDEATTDFAAMFTDAVVPGAATIDALSLEGTDPTVEDLNAQGALPGSYTFAEPADAEASWCLEDTTTPQSATFAANLNEAGETELGAFFSATTCADTTSETPTDGVLLGGPDATYSVLYGDDADLAAAVEAASASS